MSDERRDIFGSLLKVGDEVAYDPPYYKGLVIGRIVRFTPKGVVVERKKIDKEGNVSYLGIFFQSSFASSGFPLVLISIFSGNFTGNSFSGIFIMFEFSS